MLIKQDPITKLWCREDGKVLMPPTNNGIRHTYEWVSGCPKGKLGHLYVGYQRKPHYAHCIIARAFIPNPDNLPTVDHIDRNPKNNTVENLRWADRRTQNNNRQVCEDSKAKYGIRCCDDKKAYQAAYDSVHKAERKVYKAAYYASRKAEINARNAAYYAAQKAERKAYYAAYASAHKAERKAYSAAQYAAHKDGKKSYMAAYRAAQKAKGLIYRKCEDGKHHWIQKESICQA